MSVFSIENGQSGVLVESIAVREGWMTTDLSVFSARIHSIPFILHFLHLSPHTLPRNLMEVESFRLLAATAIVLSLGPSFFTCWRAVVVKSMWSISAGRLVSFSSVAAKRKREGSRGFEARCVSSRSTSAKGDGIVGSLRLVAAASPRSSGSQYSPSGSGCLILGDCFRRRTLGRAVMRSTAGEDGPLAGGRWPRWWFSMLSRFWYRSNRSAGCSTLLVSVSSRYSMTSRSIQ